MPNVEKTSTPSIWTSSQAYTLSVICLLIGLAGGWFIRGSQGRRSASSESPAPAATQAMTGQSGEPTSEQMRRMADKQAEPLLQQLGKEPNNADTLAKIGNIYYDTQQFPVAIDYYQRALKLRPADASVRTDMATAYWYTGNADLAISEFNRALADEPTSRTPCLISGWCNGRERWTRRKPWLPGSGCSKPIPTMKAKVRWLN